MNENNNKALAIFDLAMKISQNTPTDVMIRFYGFCDEVDVTIYWDGFNANDERYTSYDVPISREPRSVEIESLTAEISPDEMLGKLEEIWAAAQAKEETA